MPKMTTTPEQRTREQLEAEAADLAARLDAIRQEEFRRQQEEAQRLAQAEQDWDRQAAAGYDRKALDAEAARAEQAFRDAIATTPLVQAMAAYLTALQRRRTAVSEHYSTLDRLGHDTSRWNPADPSQYPTAELGPVQDYVTAAVQRLVTEQLDGELLDRDRQRQQFITARTEEG
ncbi:MAG: hypothetical protein M3Q22_01685 [Actinomycetota bacterium]|nr:hypothetical protein [Actinomycetota bacterium]